MAVGTGLSPNTSYLGLEACEMHVVGMFKAKGEGRRGRG